MALRPTLRLLSEDLTRQIIEEAEHVLETVGIDFTNPQAIELLEGYGASLCPNSGRILFPREVVHKAVEAAPSGFTMYDRTGEAAMELTDDRVHFVPGSAAINLLDTETGKMRKPDTSDVVRFIRVSQALANIDGLSTGLIAADVPEDVSDGYRLFLTLLYGVKPVVTGAFSAKGIAPMLDMLVTVRGSKEALAAKPLAWFSCCPSSPLKFSDATSQNVIDCARLMVPIETIAMPMSGLVAPVTLAGTIVQHAVESLSGLILAQAAREGAPVLYGGSPGIFDVRFETTPMGAIETHMIDCACAQVGKTLGLPTQAYMGLSDAKLLDAQAGLETGIGSIVAALSGINTVSGPGMLDFESCQCLEKLVLDNEICGMAKRLVTGIEPKEDFPSEGRFRELLKEKHLLISDHTMKYLGAEHFKPGPTIDRAVRQRWRDEGAKPLGERARAEVERIVAGPKAPPPPNDVKAELTKIMETTARAAGMETLPTRPPLE